MIKQVLKAVLPLAARRLFRRAEARIINSAGKLYCPVCDSRIARFEKLPRFYYEQMDAHGFDYRSRKGETCNVAAYSCPLCGASDRDRLYAFYLKTRIRDRDAGFKLLDIAPSAPLSEHIRRHFPVNYRTADLFMKGVDDKVDVTNMASYPARHFDALICSHVLEHVPDDNAAMSELYRVLKPGGWGIIMVPIEVGIDEVREDPSATSEGDRWRLFGQNDHVRTYSRRGFLERLQRAGFEVRMLYVADLGGRECLHRLGIADESVLYVSHKPEDRPTIGETVRRR